MKAPVSILLLVLSLVAAPAAAPAASPAPLTVDEIASLLEAGIGQGVILEMVASRGAPQAVSVGELLRLRSAGAGDALLETLVKGPRPGSTTRVGAPDAPAGLRTYVEVNDRGEPILHVTNLDADGRRLGGELPPAERARLAAGSSQSEHRPAGNDPEPQDAPVIVNVYTQPGPAGETPGYAGSIGSYFAAGRHPGFFFRPHRGGSRHPSVAREEFFGRPRIIDTTPYRAATAAQRNRASFRRD